MLAVKLEIIRSCARPTLAQSSSNSSPFAVLRHHFNFKMLSFFFLPSRLNTEKDKKCLLLLFISVLPCLSSILLTPILPLPFSLPFYIAHAAWFDRIGYKVFHIRFHLRLEVSIVYNELLLICAYVVIMSHRNAKPHRQHTMAEVA